MTSLDADQVLHGDEPDRAPDRQLQRGQGARPDDHRTAPWTTTRRSRAATRAATQGDVVRQGTWSVAGTGAATLTPTAEGLPVTTECSATETPPDDAGLVDASWTWTTPVVSDPVTVEAVDAPAVVTVTNTPTRIYAPFSVTKVYQGSTGALVPAPTSPGRGPATTRAPRSTPAAGGCRRPAAASRSRGRRHARRGERRDPAPGDLGVHRRGGHPLGRRARRRLLLVERAHLRSDVRDGDP